MEHVIVRWDPDQDGQWADPRPYLAVLPDFAEQRAKASHTSSR